ncbi:glycoside hydrolase superfamily [Phycomyces nitens]|nr:glycoside hydrolase superfamily [Phycomyces nitens]
MLSLYTSATFLLGFSSIYLANHVHALSKPISSWDLAYEKAEGLIGQMTLAQKVNITTGVGWMGGPCVGNSGMTTNPDFPGLCLQDSPLGVRFSGLVSSGVAGINAAASFDREAIRNRGQYMGREFRDKGVNVQLGPSMNMMRTPESGRAWEAFGEDPYLAGVASAETIIGIQSQGVIATAKHIIGNEQEHNRDTQSSEIDDKTLHEVYLWPFARSVEAGVASVMCGYNKFNGTWACENDHVLNKLLKEELGFKGFVQSDWSATHSTSDSANSGLDMTMPGDITFLSGDSYFGANLTKAVDNGQVSEERVNDMALRIVAAWYKLGQDKRFPLVNFDSFHPELGKHINVQRTHRKLIRSMGAASTVLLRNQDNILPLSAKLDKIAIIGSDAGSSLNGPNECADHGCNTGTLAQGWGSGTAEFPYLVTPLEGIQDRVPDMDIVQSFDDWNTTLAAELASGADVALVFVNSDSGEAYITVEGTLGDRNDTSLWHNGDALVNAVADANPNTIVVIHAVGAVDMPWINHKNIKAVLWAGLPGQESGNSIADVLFGDVNPSGRLPFTIAKTRSDYGPEISLNQTASYDEGVLIGHRWFDAHNIEPLFEFGFGLSYTQFSYDPLNVMLYPEQEDIKVSCSVTIKNVGDYEGAEVVQAYMKFPEIANEPPKLLRGFEKVQIKPNHHELVTFDFGKTELSYWDVDSQKWLIPSGEYTLYVGSSSRDIRQNSTFTLA